MRSSQTLKTDVLDDKRIKQAKKRINDLYPLNGYPLRKVFPWFTLCGRCLSCHSCRHKTKVGTISDETELKALKTDHSAFNDN